MKAGLHRFRRARSTYYFLAQLVRFTAKSPGTVRDEMDSQYSDGPDPWGYRLSPANDERYAVALEMLDRWRADRRLNALEVGCGEGLFTQALAPRAASLVGVDLSPPALQRAEAALSKFSHVTVRRWDAVDGPSLGQFQLVVCMDVMDVGWGPLAQRRAMRAITGCLERDGALLVTGFLQSPVIERARWARLLGRGAHGILSRFQAIDRRLVCRELRLTECHVVALLEASDGVTPCPPGGRRIGEL